MSTSTNDLRRALNICPLKNDKTQLNFQKKLIKKHITLQNNNYEKEILKN